MHTMTLYKDKIAVSRTFSNFPQILASYSQFCQNLPVNPFSAGLKRSRHKLTAPETPPAGKSASSQC